MGNLEAGGFDVEDDGQGIPEADREAIFECGYSTAGEGIGFGLAIVQGIVEAPGWQFNVTVGEASGARFEIAAVDRDN